MKINDYLKALVKEGGSDLHLKVGRPPLMRIKGDLIPMQYPPISKKQMEEILSPMLTDIQRRKLIEKRELDFSYLVEGVARFRSNFFYQLESIGAVFRVVPIEIKTLDELGLPEILKEIVSKSHGLVLITGPTGCGKSTTLAALIKYLNENVHKHIITIEDPVEFVYVDKLCTITQREVGADTHSFSEAFKGALRQDPDIISVGEMRDPETIQTALTASETGHLVISTLHTNYAKQSISRIIDTFPPEQQHHITIRTAVSLVATVAQQLVKRSDGSGMVAILEIMISTPTIRKLISEQRLDEIDKTIAESAHLYKMQTINQHLLQLIKDDILTKEDALNASYNPNDLRVMLQTQTAYKGSADKKSPFASKPPWMKDKG